MKNLNYKAIALALGFAFSASAMAQNMSKSDYQAGKDKIAAEYKSSKANCDSFSGNPKDICVAEVKGREKIAKAELELNYKPSPKARYKLSVAKAEADYAVANERCDDLAGNAQDVCVKEAKAVATAAKADAKAQMKTTNANIRANEKSSEARNEANEKTFDARKNAAADKADAGYAVAIEKCDVYAGEAKDHCVNQAKVNYGK